MLTALLISLAGIATNACKKSGIDPDTIINNSSICKILSVKKVYDVQRHCAFSDLIKWKGNWYLVFRASDDHAYTQNGTIEVLKSSDGSVWEPEISYESAEKDLRDPKFDINNNQLIVYAQGVKFNSDKTVNFQQGVIIEAEKTEFNRIVPYDLNYGFPAYWPWRFSKLDNVSYAIGYNQSPKVLKIVETKDFKDFVDVCDLSYIQKTPSEGTLRFNNNKCYALIRRTGPTILGISNIADLCNFKWIELPMIGLGGPNFLVYDNNTLIISGRDYLTKDYSYGNGRTSLFIYKIKENKTYRIATLPSGGDTGYPGLYLNNNQLWISYHSTHEGTTKIYLAKVELQINNL